MLPRHASAGRSVFALIVVSLVVACEGAEGPLGPEGSRGPQGPQGPQGPPGEPATLGELAESDGTAPNNVGDANQVHWDRLTGMPSGFADGVDNGGEGTAYAAGEGISITSGNISVSWGGTGAATSASRSDHHHDTRYTLSSALSSSDGDGPNSGSNLLHWDLLTGVPSGFADGVDDGGGTIADGSVTTAKLADDAVTQSKLANGAVASNHLAQMGASADQVLTWTGSSWAPQSSGGVPDGSITTEKLANDAVTSAKISAGAVGASELASNAVGMDITRHHMGNFSVGRNELRLFSGSCPSGTFAMSGAWDLSHFALRVLRNRASLSSPTRVWEFVIYNSGESGTGETAVLHINCGRIVT